MSIPKKKPSSYKPSTSYKDGDFSSVSKFISDIDGDAVLAEDYSEIYDTEFIHSGSYILNAQLSGSLLGGVPGNKFLAIGGDPKTGKTYLVMNIIRCLQNMGYFAYVSETEGAWSKDRMVSQNINTKLIKINAEQETITQVLVTYIRLTDSALKLKKEGKPYPKLVLVIDSQNGLNSKKEIADALEGDTKTDMGTKARELKLLYSTIVPRCNRLGWCIITTAHIYEKDMGNYRKRTPSGGNGALFMASNFLGLSKGHKKDAENQKLGIYIYSEIFESRYTKNIPIKMYLPNDEPMNDYYGLDEFISWEICGIEKGKFVPIFDFIPAILANKKYQLDDLLNDKTITEQYLNGLIPKTRQESFEGSMDYMFGNGYFEFGDSQNIVITNKCKLLFERTELENKLFKMFGSDEAVTNDTIQESKDNVELLSLAYADGYVTKANGFYKSTKKLKNLISTPSYNSIDEQVVFLNDKSPKYAVRHLKTTVTFDELFTPEVFTDEVLHQIDSKVVKPMFTVGMKSDAPITHEMSIDSEELDMEKFLSQ